MPNCFLSSRIPFPDWTPVRNCGSCKVWKRVRPLHRVAQRNSAKAFMASLDGSRCWTISSFLQAGWEFDSLSACSARSCAIWSWIIQRLTEAAEALHAHWPVDHSSASQLGKNRSARLASGTLEWHLDLDLLPSVIRQYRTQYSATTFWWGCFPGQRGMPPGCPEVLAGGMPNLDFLCCCVRRYDDDVGTSVRNLHSLPADLLAHRWMNTHTKQTTDLNWILSQVYRG